MAAQFNYLMKYFVVWAAIVWTKPEKKGGIKVHARPEWYLKLRHCCKAVLKTTLNCHARQIN
jgi:hypothetical protein